MLVGIFSVAAHTSIVRCSMFSVMLAFPNNSFNAIGLRGNAPWTNSSLLIFVADVP
jgi:hypothetical protein